MTSSELYKDKFKSYLSGFLLSLLFTIIAFAIVTENLLSGDALIAALLIFAVLQAAVQLMFFLHLKPWPKKDPITGKRDEDSVWNVVILVSTIGVILIIVVGSIWIMANLNYNMTPQQMNQYIQSQDGI